MAPGRRGWDRAMSISAGFPRGYGDMGRLVKRRHRRGGEVEQFAGAAFVNLAGPERVLQQGAADGDEVEVAALQAPQQLVHRPRLRGLAAVGRDELAREADRADGDRHLAGELLGPAGEVEVGAFEFRLPKPALR